MELDYLAAVIAVFGSVGAAAERFVAVAKLVFPSLRDDPSTPPPVGPDWRGIRVYVVAYLGGLLAAAFWNEGGTWGIDGHVAFAVGADAHKLPVAVVALFGMAGSAFWSGMLGFVSAAKDIRGATLKGMQAAPKAQPDQANAAQAHSS